MKKLSFIIIAQLLNVIPAHANSVSESSVITQSMSQVRSMGEQYYSECNDGIDNDGDGFVDYANDQGCYGPNDSDEISGKPEEEDGWTTYEKPHGVEIYYVSSDGNDNNAGNSPESPYATFSRAISNYREGRSVWILFKRGDAFDFDIDLTNVRGESIQRPVLISSYGTALTRPKFMGGRISAIKSSENISVIGLHSVAKGPVLENPNTSGIRFVGNHKGLLFEDNLFEYGQIILQRYGKDSSMSEIFFRRNSVIKAFDVGFHSQGLYAEGVSGLYLEENIFDHNGWLPRSDNQHLEPLKKNATMYNHNMYLSESQNIRVRRNIILRASSMGIKVRSDVEGGARDIVIDNNLFVEGEIGIGIGGNTSEKFRFHDVTIKKNAFLSIGRSQPTSRDISWPLLVTDIRNLRVEDNLFAHQDKLSNSYAIHIGNTLHNAVIEKNLIYGISHVGIQINGTSMTSVYIQDNIVHDSQSTCSSGFLFNKRDENTIVRRNHLFVRECKDKFLQKLFGHMNLISMRNSAIADYLASTNDSDARFFKIEFNEPVRSLESYNETLTGEFSVDDFARKRIQRFSRFGTDNRYSAKPIIEYLFQGFQQSESNS